MGQIKDITGQKFGRLTAIKFSHRQNRRTFWIFKCDCGTERTMRRDGVTQGATKSCGCAKHKRKDVFNLHPKYLTPIKHISGHSDGDQTWTFKCICQKEINLKLSEVLKYRNKSCGCQIKDIVNHKFNKLTLIRFIEKRKHRDFWECRCDCGNICTKSIEQIKCNKVKSCGCLTKEVGQRNKHLLIERNKQKGKEYRQKILGSKFGKLTIIEDATPHGRTSYSKFQCDCGNEIILPTFSVVGNGKYQRKCCGCENIYIKHRFSRGISSPHYKGYKELSGRYWSSLQKGAQTRGLPFDITMEYAYSILEQQNFKCSLSNMSIKLEPSAIKKQHNNKLQTASLDRIDDNKGYIKDNIQWIHKELQSLKMNLTETQFLTWCHKISEYQKHKLQENIEYII